MGWAPRLLALHLGASLLLLTLGRAILDPGVTAPDGLQKLANPAMGRAMLGQEPVLNLLAPVAVGPDAFVVVAGLVEVLLALLVLSGAAPQVASLVATVPFTAGLALFGGTELIGHLPVYEVLLTLLVLGSNDRTAPLVHRLRLPRLQTTKA